MPSKKKKQKKKMSKAEKRIAKARKNAKAAKIQGPPMLSMKMSIKDVDNHIAAFRTCGLPARIANEYADFYMKEKQKALTVGGKKDEKKNP